MDKAKKEHLWPPLLKYYSEQNAGRPTRLGVFESGDGDLNDLWIEDGLPLTGIDVDPKNIAPTIEIVLGNYTHVVKAVRSVEIRLSADGEEDGLNVTDLGGKTTILRFEND